MGSSADAEKQTSASEARCPSRFCFNSKCASHRWSSFWLLFWMSCASCVQGMLVNGFVNVSITTIERRYNLQSKSSGLIASSYDIASLLVTLPASYLGSRPGASRPRWLACGTILIGLGSLLFALPHYLVPPYIDPSEGVDMMNGTQRGLDMMMCNDPKIAKDSCTAGDNVGLSNYLYIFFFGQFLSGIGATPLFTIGLAYLDEMAPAGFSSVFIAMFLACATGGPALGYLLGGQFLKQYIDMPYINPDDFGLTQSNDLWLGNWWLGFLICGICGILAAIPIFRLPLGASVEDTDGKRKDKHVSDQVVASGIITSISKENLKSMSVSLLRNGAFTSLSISKAFDSFLVVGVAPFVPKIFEIQLGYSASSSALLVGAVLVPTGITATLLAGLLIKKFSMTFESILKMSLAISSVTLLALLSLLVHCPNPPFAGIDPHGSISNPQLTSACNVDCGCDDAAFTPICGANGITYFSPCHAGCSQSFHSENGMQMYTNCTCIDNLAPMTISSLAGLMPGDAVIDKCSIDCMHISLPLLMLAVVFASVIVTSVPNIALTLKSVRPWERSYGMGLQLMAFRAFGTIPSSILIGYAIDQACTMWDQNCLGEGSCLVYDKFLVSRYFFVVLFCAKFLSTAGYALAWIFKDSENDPGTDDGRNPTENHGYPQVIAESMGKDPYYSNPSFE